MTVINGIEIDNIHYSKNSIKEAIENNDPIEEKLHVIAVISNPCLYAKRYILIKEFIKRMETDEKDIILYVVEMAYGNQKFIITNKNNNRHLQLRTHVPLWHKENMINLGVKYLLPPSWKAFAWIDADVEFESSTWANDTLKILNGAKDIVQIFSHCLDMDNEENTMNIFSSAGFNHCKNKKYSGKGLDYWHPGFAWAMTRKSYERIGGLYEIALLGSGDNIMLFSLIGNGLTAVNEKSTEDYKNTILQYQKKIKFLRFGYTPGVIRHFFHGSKKNRKYTERWQILIKHNYSPNQHITYDQMGILIPTVGFPKEMGKEIFEYFQQRNEDE
jgi:hypothetical protein